MPHNVLVLTHRPLPAAITTSPLIDEITVITEPGHPAAQAGHVDVHLVSSVDDITAVRDATLNLLANRRIDAVLTPYEFGVEVAGYLRSHFGLPGMGYETANAFSNKYVMKQRLAAAGIAVAPFRQVPRLDNLATAAKDLGWPLVIKTAFGGGSIDVVALHSPDEFRDYCASDRSQGLRTAHFPLVAEQFIDMEAEFHCDGVVHDGQTRFAAVSRYLAPVLQGMGGFHGTYHLPADDPDAQEIRRLHQRVVEILGMRSGVTHLEVFKTQDGLLVGEIACRPGGGPIVESITRQYGVDMWRTFVETALGLEPDVSGRSPEQLVLSLFLPARPGRITELSSTAELLELPGAIGARLHHAPGDVIGRTTNSHQMTGTVFLAADTVDELMHRMNHACEAYRLEVEPAHPVVAS